jgi:hypothetical protein
MKTKRSKRVGKRDHLGGVGGDVGGEVPADEEKRGSSATRTPAAP